jgi:hypothetical protein
MIVTAFLALACKRAAKRLRSTGVNTQNHSVMSVIEIFHQVQSMLPLRFFA